MTVKYRVQGLNSIIGVRQGSGGVDIEPPYRVYYANKLEYLWSDGNPFFRLGRNGNRLDIGSPFTTQKVEVKGDFDLTTHVVPKLDGSIRYRYQTILVPHFDVGVPMQKWAGYRTSTNYRSGVDTYTDPGFTHSGLTALGTQAVANFSPLNPIADTVTTMAEFLSERKFFSTPGTADSVGGEYLNYQFGIAPSVGYAKDLRDAIQNRQKHLDQLHRDSGRWIRRRGVVYEDSTNEVDSKSGGVYAIGPIPNSITAPPGILTTHTRKEQKAWFSGAFTYYLPREGTMLRSVAELDKLYGVKPNVDTAWELLPYSWLVDYKTSAGDALKNMSAFGSDGLVMPYGYIMGMTKVTTEYTWTGRVYNSGGVLAPITVSAAVVKTTKQRIPANPFGFGILPGDLNDRQWSILTALGLSRLT